MSNKFREAFKKTLTTMWRKKRSSTTIETTYSVLSRCPPSARRFQRSASDGVENHINSQIGFKPSFRRSYDVLHQNKPSPGGGAFKPIVLSSQNIALSTVRFENKGSRRHSDNLQGKYLGTFRYRMCHLFARQRNHYNNHILRHQSVDSGHTISNSSLQDMDEIDYSSTDLVRYMEEINEDIA